MPQTPVYAGQIDVELETRAFDVNGAYTGLAFNTSGLTVKYRRQGSALSSAITLKTQSATGAHDDGGFVHLEGGNYRFDAPDAAFVAGVRFVDFFFYGVSGVLIDTVRCPIANSDPLAAAATDYATASALDAVDNFVDTEITAIQSALTTLATYVDTEVAAIKAQTDQLAFTSGKVHAQVKGMDTDTITNTAMASSAISELQGGIAYQVLEMLVGAGTVYIRENGTNIEIVQKSDDTVLATSPRTRSVSALNPVTQLGA